MNNAWRKRHQHRNHPKQRGSNGSCEKRLAKASIESSSRRKSMAYRNGSASISMSALAAWRLLAKMTKAKKMK
jgi:hypothetical protein